MTHKIEGYGPNGLAAANRAKSAEPASPPSTGVPVGKVAATDSIRLTGDAVFMNHVERSVAAAPAVSDKRVAQVRQALADGTYKVNPRTIAERLLRLEWEMGGVA